MTKRTQDRVARLTLACLVLALVPSVAHAADGARLEGYLLGVDGRAASGYRVHLIDETGKDVAQAATSEAGVYRFRDLPKGEYSLGIEDPGGGISPVAAPPMRLGADELGRRDVKLRRATNEERDAVGVENPSFGLFWAGLSPPLKATAIIGVIVVLGLVITGLDDEDASSP